MSLRWGELYSQLISGARERKELISASFELTARCNLQCKMCYVSHSVNDLKTKAKELTTAEWIRLAEEARDAGLLFLTLTGGEVFIREDFKTIYEKFMQMGFVIQIYTNGTLLTKDHVNWLASIPPSKVSITLYGASRKTYQEVTGYAEGFDKTIRAIDDLLAKGITTEIKTTVIQGTRYEFDALLDIALQRKLQLGIVNYVSPNRECSHSDPVGNRLSSQELLQYEIHMSEREQQLTAENIKDITKITDAVTEEVMPAKLDVVRLKDTPALAFPCLAGTSAAWVTWDGRLLPCGLLDIPETNPLEKGFKAAWEELKNKCTLIPVCKECQECKYQSLCEHCPARLFRETGYYDQPAPYLCELAQSRSVYKDRMKA
ncbi:radical SAM protein [Desulfosporosinus sp. OT]|uniref:radical SAM protein n=1 Tax=Desulfosporosinus sp. OT TaxID=913865 RepID=UPI000223A7A1|nr:radical SAM protein [Desulfosporosinus sp. OT]EGW38459.1 radical SAM superfamily protein [Desulfosporosinus sp. OT]